LATKSPPLDQTTSEQGDKNPQKTKGTTKQREMICRGQLTVPQPPLCIKIINFNSKMSFDGTSKDIFVLKYTYLMKRGGKGTTKSRPLHIRAPKQNRKYRTT
jgi:hypothetical protein